MKIIFLDIDGVLNSERWYRKRYEEISMSEVAEKYPHYEFDPVSVTALNKLIELSGAKVVVSSTWRFGRSIEELQELLDSIGFRGEVIGKTGNLPDEVRGAEIKEWIDETSSRISVESFLILDDDKDMLKSQMKNFVHVDRFDGLTENLIEECLRILT